MTVLRRAGWLLSAAIAGVIAASVLHVPFAGALPAALLALVAALSFIQPGWALPLVAAVVPVAWYGASQQWNAQVGWAEALACAGLTGLGLDACRSRAPRTPASIAVPAGLLGALTIAAAVVSLRVVSLRLGPAFGGTLVSLFTTEYFVDLRTAPGLHAGLLLLESLLLFAHASRLTALEPVMRRTCRAAVIGATAAALCTIVRLVSVAVRADSFWESVAHLSLRVRWNVHYADANAAGSYYALILPIAAGLAWTAVRGARIGWITCTVVIAAGLFLTGSRMALLAVPAGCACVLLVLQIGSRRALLKAGAIAAAAIAILVALIVMLPQRGLQQSSWAAADTRIGLLQTGARMIRTYPAFGIGLGQFYERSAEFSSPALLAAFPAVAAHGENAHNNFLQIAAELGVIGGLAFTWAIAAAFLALGPQARGDRFRQSLLAGLTVFVLTCLGGHPLLIPEVAFTFWILAGVGTGTALQRPAHTTRATRVARLTMIAAVIAIALSVPARMRDAVAAADLEHVGIGVSAWQLSPDGIRYRDASGRLSLFVPTGAFKFSVNPRTGAPVTLEITLDGRVINAVTLTPQRWNDIAVPARTVTTTSRYARMDLRTVDDANAVLWVTKVEPVGPR